MSSIPRLDVARELYRALEAGDEAAADLLIGELNEQKSRAILRQLAELTREVHSSFYGVASDPRLIEITKHAMPDARDRLHYVIEKTEESAHRTLGAVEEMIGVTDSMVTNAQALESALAQGPVDAARLRDFVDASKAYGERVQRGLTEVLMAQEYQDLTGQVIKRTIDIVNELERGLVALITHEWVDKGADATTRPVDPIAAQGPAVRGQAGVVSQQTDVDDLLASLGV
ncbi:MAG: protein phosphatase CheZ [Gammaproteobacteria bacterium]